MSSRLTGAFDELIDRMEDPPTWEEITTHQVRTTSPTGFDHRWSALVAAVAGVAVIGVFAALLAGDGRLASATIPYVKIDWAQEVEMRCLGMEIEDNGGFDSAVVEIWGPTSDNLYRLDATAPDGTVERQILEMGADDRLVRAWYSLPLMDSEEDSVFRVSQCANSGRGSSYSMAQPPLSPTAFQHEEFIHYPSVSPGGGSLDRGTSLADHFDDQRPGEWRGEPVTVFSESHSGVDELGSVTRREELWVDLESGRAERHSIEVDSEVLGEQSIAREVADRAEVSPNDVSLDPDGLYSIFDSSEDGTEREESVTTTEVLPMAQPLMEEATEIQAGDIPTPALRQAISPEEGDQLFTVPADDFEVLVRLRAGHRPHIYATSCDVLVLVDLPEGWDGTCLERTVNGERQSGRFPYGTVSD